MIPFEVPTGFFEKKIQLYLSDDDGEREIYSRYQEPGQIISIGIRSIGKAKIKIYIDGKFYEERKLTP